MDVKCIVIMMMMMMMMISIYVRVRPTNNVGILFNLHLIEDVFVLTQSSIDC